MNKITIKEIAEKAKVSIGTVDRVLHNRGKVNGETERQIRKICAEYGYESNIIGKAMSMQKKERVIAVVINSSKRNVFSSIVHEGLEKRAKEIADFNVRFEYYDYFENSVSEISDILDAVYEKEISGLIIKPLDSPIIKYKLGKFIDIKKIPVVTCTSEIAGVNSICYVGQNHEKLGRLMANTLCKISHDDVMKVIVVVGPLSSAARRAKLEGFLNYLEESGRKYEVCNICEVPYDDDEAYEMALNLLERYPEANAIYMHSPQLPPCVKAICDYGKFNGVRFTFGHSSYVGEYIRSGLIDFAIYEDPYDQGYVAADVMFNYLLNGIVPENREYVLDGVIAFEENC